MNARIDLTPIACTLGPDDLKARLNRIAQLAQRHLIDQRRAGSALHLLYAREAAPELRSIVELEKECCAFLGFELVEHSKGLELTVTAPAEAGEFAGVLFEHFSTSAAEAVAKAAAPRCATSCSCRGAASSAS